MGDVVNLRIWRKRQVKDEAARVAAQNREVHGQPRQERARQLEAKSKAAKHLDQHKLDPRPDETA